MHNIEKTNNTDRRTQSSKPVNFRGDTLNNPTLTHSICSPIDDVLYLSSIHWRGQKSVTQAPNFDLFPYGEDKHAAPVKTNKSDEYLTFSVGSLSAAVNIQPKAFDLSFRYKHRQLTKLGWRSIGYVK